MLRGTCSTLLVPQNGVSVAGIRLARPKIQACFSPLAHTPFYNCPNNIRTFAGASKQTPHTGDCVFRAPLDIQPSPLRPASGPQGLSVAHTPEKSKAKKTSSAWAHALCSWFGVILLFEHKGTRSASLTQYGGWERSTERGGRTAPMPPSKEKQGGPLDRGT